MIDRDSIHFTYTPLKWISVYTLTHKRNQNPQRKERPQGSKSSFAGIGDNGCNVDEHYICNNTWKGSGQPNGGDQLLMGSNMVGYWHGIWCIDVAVVANMFQGLMWHSLVVTRVPNMW